MTFGMTGGHVTRGADVTGIEWIGGSVHHVLLDGAATEGRLTLVRSSMAGGAGSPVHVHERDDETVHLIAGEGEFWVGDQHWTLRSGDTAFLPRGVPHTYAFTSERAEILAVCNPSGMEHFFREAGWDLSRPRPEDWALDLATLRQAAADTGQTILGPPLAPGDEMPAEHLRG